MTKTSDYLNNLIEDFHKEASDALNDCTIGWRGAELRDRSNEAPDRLKAALADWVLEQVLHHLQGEKVDWAGIKALNKMRLYHATSSQAAACKHQDPDEYAVLYSLAQATEKALRQILTALTIIDSHQQQAALEKEENND